MPLYFPHRALAAAVAVWMCAAPLQRVAHAAITPEAARVVGRYLAATGGAAAFAAESTAYTRAKVTGFGFTGTYESWVARPDRQYSRTALGPFELAEGDDGRKAWRTDPTNFDPKQMVQDGLSAPLHEGAARYYKERGWIK